MGRVDETLSACHLHEVHFACASRVRRGGIRDRVDAPLGRENDSCPVGHEVDRDLHPDVFREQDPAIQLLVGHCARVENVPVRAQGGVRYLVVLLQADDVLAGLGASRAVRPGLHDLRVEPRGQVGVNLVPLVQQLDVVFPPQVGFQGAEAWGIPEPGASRRGQSG